MRIISNNALINQSYNTQNWDVFRWCFFFFFSYIILLIIFKFNLNNNNNSHKYFMWINFFNIIFTLTKKRT